MRVELCKGNTSKIAKANPVTSDEVATKFVKKTPALDSSITCVLPSTSSQPAAGSSRKASPTSSSPTGQQLGAFSLFFYRFKHVTFISSEPFCNFFFCPYFK